MVLAAGLAALWEHALKDSVLPKRWGVIEKGALYRSGQLPAPLLRRVLARHGIRVVVDMTPIEPDNVKQAAESRLLAELQIALVRCPLSGDGTGDPVEYARALTALVHARRDGAPALVHCQAGSQRTGGVVAAYRLLFRSEEHTSELQSRQYLVADGLSRCPPARNRGPARCRSHPDRTAPSAAPTLAVIAPLRRDGRWPEQNAFDTVRPTPQKNEDRR